MRIWTLDEANAALPEVAELVRRLRTLAGATRQRQERTRGNGAASGNGHAPHVGDAPAELRVVLDELTERGIVARDPERGLIDFPARSPTGRDYLLCFLDGEDAIGWWHWPDAGFAGRTPITELPD